MRKGFNVRFLAGILGALIFFLAGCSSKEDKSTAPQTSKGIEKRLQHMPKPPEIKEAPKEAP
jgi:hypothetical protein